MYLTIATYILGCLLHFIYRYWEWSAAEEHAGLNMWDYLCKFKGEFLLTAILIVFFGGWWVSGYEIGGIQLSGLIPVTWPMGMVMGFASDSFIKANIFKIPILMDGLRGKETLNV